MVMVRPEFDVVELSTSVAVVLFSPSMAYACTMLLPKNVPADVTLMVAVVPDVTGALVIPTIVRWPPVRLLIDRVVAWPATVTEDAVPDTALVAIAKAT
jgi:hypothetical protein